MHLFLRPPFTFVIIPVLLFTFSLVLLIILIAFLIVIMGLLLRKDLDFRKGFNFTIKFLIQSLYFLVDSYFIEVEYIVATIIENYYSKRISFITTIINAINFFHSLTYLKDFHYFRLE